MSHFSYSFCLSLFHSVWQSALLLLVYAVLNLSVNNQSPFHKKNMLFGLLVMQLIISFFTFTFYFGSVEVYTETVDGIFSPSLLNKHTIEKISPFMFIAYSMIVSFRSCYLFYNWKSFKITHKKLLLKPALNLKLFTGTKAIELGIKKNVVLWFSNIISTPLTYGFFKPVIIMPVALINHMMNLLLIASETLFFFNPFIKIIAGKIRLEREKNCDVEVLQSNYPVVNYAEALLKVATFKRPGNSFSLPAVFRKKELLQRIQFFTVDSNLIFRKKTNPFAFILIIVARVNYKSSENVKGTT